MPAFYSPQGNLESWVKKPKGYFSVEEWQTAHPAPKPEPPTLEEISVMARTSLREKRKEIEYGGFDLDGQHWDSTEKGELRLNSVMKLFDSGIPQYDGWKIAEGVYIVLTPEVVQRAALALMQHYGRCFSVEAAKLAEIDALESVGAVEAWLATELNQGW